MHPMQPAPLPKQQGIIGVRLLQQALPFEVYKSEENPRHLLVLQGMQQPHPCQGHFVPHRGLTLVAISYDWQLPG